MLFKIICAPNFTTSKDDSVLTLARVAMGMKIGVSTTPCGSVNFPRRAFPFVLRTSNITGRFLHKIPFLSRVDEKAKIQ